jgi:ABC-type branched-subunit amino acid transport system substrate-binding protein
MGIMKNCSRNIFTLLLTLLLAISCAPKQVVVTEPTAQPQPLRADRQLLADAESQLEQKNFELALSTYRRYIERYPDGADVDLAMLGMGKAYTRLGSYEAAREQFNRLLSERPQSPRATDAKIGILNLFYLEGRYPEVIQLSSVILEEASTGQQVSKTYIILGDTYLAMQSPEDAVYFYTMAAKESDDLQGSDLVEKLKTAIGMLEPPEIESLLGYVEEELPRGYLMFELGVKYAQEGDYDQAQKALSGFLAAFPQHELSSQAKALRDEISEKTFYYQTTVGLLLPLSGRYQAYGNRALKGIELAMFQFNSRPQVQPIHLIVKDTGSEPDRVVVAMEELLQEKVAAIIGPLVGAEYAASIAQENGIPIITITQKEKITEIGDNVFRNFLTPQMQVKRLVNFAAETLAVQNFAILYPEEKYGATFMNLFWDEVVATGGRVVGIESYNPAHTDFADSIKKLVGLYYEVPSELEPIIRPPEEEDPVDAVEDPNEDGVSERQRKEEEPEAIVDFEAIFIPDAPTKTGLIVPQLAFYDVEDVYLLGTNLWHHPKLIEMARDYVQGAIMPDGFFAGSRSARIRNFVDVFESTYGDQPGFIEATTYDTAAMLFDVISRPEVRTRTAIREALLDIRDYPGVTGMTSFDATGDALKQLSLLQIEGSRFVELE